VSYDFSSFGLLPTYRQYELQEIVKDIPKFTPKRLFFSKYTHIIRRLLQYSLNLQPGVCYINELRTNLDERVFSSSRYKFIYLDGYWQNKKYIEWCVSNIPQFSIRPWKEMPEILHDEFTFISNNTCISMHVRRGDYLKKENASIMALCSERYFSDSLKLIRSKVPEAKLVIFSDDPAWVKDNLKFDIDTKVIDNKDVSPIWYIFLMSICKHHIISNSTFSWWGAVLSRNKDTITSAPTKWFNSNPLPPIYLDSWVLTHNGN